MSITQVSLSSVSNYSAYVHPLSDVYDDRRTLIQKVADRCLSLLREISYTFRNLLGRIRDYFQPSFDVVDSKKTWKAESEGLYVLVHGLRGHPGIWQSQIDEFKNDEGKDIFVPYVPLKGNGPIDEVAAPILEVIADYVSKNPGKPVCLLGVSNGGRICTWLETRLRSIAPSTPVKISTIAAVHFGSSRMDLIHRCYELTGWSCGYDISVVNELRFGSEKAKEILNAVSQPLAEETIREYEFYASTEDFQVPELISSLPKLGNVKVVNHVVNGYDHNGIVSGVSAEQVKSCREWINQFSN